MGALPRPDIPPGAQRDLNAALHDLHHHAGWPSLRVLAKAAGCSHTTVSAVFSLPRLPSWGVVEVLVEAMGGDTAEFHRLWIEASSADGDTAPAASGIAGRRAELAAVRRHLESGSGLLVVTGEAGIGKTTLVRAAAESVDAFVAVGHCLQLSREVPLLPVIEALRVLLEVDDGQWVKEGLADCPAYVRTSLSRLLPELDVAGTAPPLDDPWGVEKLLASVTSILGTLAAARPLALHIEDCHWADRSTLDLLTHLASAPPRVPLVLTWRSRDPEVSSDHTQWLSRARWTSGVPTLELGPLTLDETAQQLRLLTGSRADADEVERIQARSQGLPLYTAQLASAPSDAVLPQHLADLLNRRIGDLDGGAWRVARTLGVAQRPVAPSLLRAVSGLDADETADALRVLARRGLLRENARDDAELSHPLFIDAIHRRLLPGEGPEVHARLAQALSEEPGIEPAEVADHWQAADRPDLEVAHRVHAATRASNRFAHREALDAWLRVLQLWDAGRTTGDIELWDVLAKALDAAVEVGDIDAGRALARRASALDLPDRQRAVVLQRIGAFLIDDGMAEAGLARLDEALELMTALSPSPELRELLSERVNFFVQSGRFDEAEVELRRGLEAFGTQEDPRWQRRRLAASIWLAGQAGDLDTALAAARNALAVELPEPDPMADLMIAVNATGVMLYAATPPARAVEIAHDVLGRAEASNLMQSYAGVLLRANVCWAYLRAGDLAAARELLHPVTRSRPDLNTALAHLLLGAVELREGHVVAALERCRAADAQVRNRNQNWAEGVPWHAEVELWAGQLDPALDLLREALDVSLPTQSASHAAPLLCLRARVLADRLDGMGATAAERRKTSGDLRQLRTRASTDPFEHRPLHAAAQAMTHLWQAELARIEGTATRQLWLRAATVFERLTWPHDAAYCRWRAAQVALREGEATLASRLLRSALAGARHHAPLSEAIAATARGA